MKISKVIIMINRNVYLILGDEAFFVLHKLFLELTEDPLS